MSNSEQLPLEGYEQLSLDYTAGPIVAVENFPADPMQAYVEMRAAGLDQPVIEITPTVEPEPTGFISDPAEHRQVTALAALSDEELRTSGLSELAKVIGVSTGKLLNTGGRDTVRELATDARTKKTAHDEEVTRRVAKREALKTEIQSQEAAAVKEAIAKELGAERIRRHEENYTAWKQGLDEVRENRKIANLSLKDISKMSVTELAALTGASASEIHRKGKLDFAQEAIKNAKANIAPSAPAGIKIVKRNVAAEAISTEIGDGLRKFQSQFNAVTPKSKAKDAPDPAALNIKDFFGTPEPAAPAVEPLTAEEKAKELKAQIDSALDSEENTETLKPIDRIIGEYKAFITRYFKENGTFEYANTTADSIALRKHLHDALDAAALVLGNAEKLDAGDVKQAIMERTDRYLNAVAKNLMNAVKPVDTVPVVTPEPVHEPTLPVEAPLAAEVVALVVEPAAVEEVAPVVPAKADLLASLDADSDDEWSPADLFSDLSPEDQENRFNFIVSSTMNGSRVRDMLANVGNRVALYHNSRVPRMLALSDLRKFIDEIAKERAEQEGVDPKMLQQALQAMADPHVARLKKENNIPEDALPAAAEAPAAKAELNDAEYREAVLAKANLIVGALNTFNEEKAKDPDTLADFNDLHYVQYLLRKDWAAFHLQAEFDDRPVQYIADKFLQTPAAAAFHHMLKTSAANAGYTANIDDLFDKLFSETR